MLHATSHRLCLARALGFLAFACVARGQGLTETDAVRAAHFAPHVVYQEGIDAARMGLLAVQTATQIAGTPNPVTTGTLRYDGIGVTYVADPRDRLIVSLPDGDREFAFNDLQGTLTSVDAFLSGDHSLGFSVVRDGQIGMQFSSLMLRGARRMTAAGTMVNGGVTYAIDLVNEGTYSAESDATGGTVRDDNTWTGTVTAPDFALTVNESWSFFLIRAGQTVDTTDGRTIRNVLDFAGSRYEWAGVQMRKSFRNGNPSQIDTYWQVTGAITRDGAPFGEYRLSIPILIDPWGSPIEGELRIMLRLPGGDTALQTWIVR